MSALDIERFRGGRTLMLGSAGVGVLGLLLTVVGFFVSPREAGGSVAWDAHGMG